jgi:hypothetical protein
MGALGSERSAGEAARRDTQAASLPILSVADPARLVNSTLQASRPRLRRSKPRSCFRLAVETPSSGPESRGRRMSKIASWALTAVLLAGCDAGRVTYSCEPATPIDQADIQSRLTIRGAVRHVYSVAICEADGRCRQGTPYLSADIEGAGLEGTDDIATWARDLSGGRLYSVDALARQYSSWLPDPRFSMADGAARASADCARRNPRQLGVTHGN